MNQNYKTDKEFENFLEKIGGLQRTYRIDKGPVLKRKEFGIGNGWLGIIQRLFEVLIKLGWDKSIINVKEKFGGMSIFLDNLPENGFNFIVAAERETFQVCEVCGEDGGQHNINGWIHTLCDEHKDKKRMVEVGGVKYILQEKETIINGDQYYDAQKHTILRCETDSFFDPWRVKVIEIIKK